MDVEIGEEDKPEEGRGWLNEGVGLCGVRTGGGGKGGGVWMQVLTDCVAAQFSFTQHLWRSRPGLIAQTCTRRVCGWSEPLNSSQHLVNLLSQGGGTWPIGLPLVVELPRRKQILIDWIFHCRLGQSCCCLISCDSCRWNPKSWLTDSRVFHQGGYKRKVLLWCNIQTVLLLDVLLTSSFTHPALIIPIFQPLIGVNGTQEPSVARRRADF